jgi:glycosyltransferase involved in cell wall biosynthesis
MTGAVGVDKRGETGGGSQERGLSILHLTKTSLLAGGGGAERRADAVTRRLAANGHRVTVLSGKTDPDLSSETEDAGREIRHVTCVPDIAFATPTLGFYLARYLFAFASLPALVALLWRRDVDVLVENMTPYPTFAVLVARLFDVPVVAVQHEFFDRSCYDIYDPLTATIQLALQNVHRLFAYDRLVVPTAHVRQQFVEYGVPPDRIEVIPNGVDATALDHPDIDPEPGRLLTLGRLIRRKEVETILRAVRRLREEGHEIELDIAGDGPDRDRLESIAERLDLGDAVRFHGYVDDDGKVELLNRADVFVIASRQEGFGLVVLEAMAAGTPVVARHLPVYEEFFVDGDHGRLVAAGPEALADGIDDLLADRDRLTAMGERGRETARDHSWDAVADRTEAVLRDVAARDTTARRRTGVPT